MSVVAVSLPEFQPWNMSLVALMDSRKMAAMIDGSGLSPPAASSVAFRTMNAAATGTKLFNTRLTKLWNAVPTPEIQPLELEPGFPGIGTPCAPIHWRISGRVSKITVHMIHFPVRPVR
jgi:hypothetical protein